MSKSLTAWFFLGFVTLVLLGCGADNQVASQQEKEPCKGADAMSPACLPPPDPCELSPLAADCLPDLLSITSPARNSVWTTPTMSLAVSFLQGSVPSGLTLTLNGNNILRYATINAKGATIKGSAVESLLVNGDNTFQAQSGSEIEKLVFVYDREPPRIIVTTVKSAASGSTSPVPGDTIEVTGVVRDAAAVSDLTINGTAATLSDGHNFTAQIPYADIYRLVATDTVGQTGSIDFAAPQHRFDPAVALKVNNSIFNLVKPLINEALANLDASTLFDPKLHVPFGNTGSAEMGISRLDIDKGGKPSVKMRFVPANSKSSRRPMVLEVGITLPKVGAGMSVYKAHSDDRLGTVNVDISDFNVTLQLELTTDNTDHLKLALVSATPFNLAFSKIAAHVDAECTRLDCTWVKDFANWLLGVVSEIFSDNAKARSFLLDFLNQAFAPNIASALAKLDLPNIPTQIPLDTNNDDSIDTQLTIDMAPSLLTTDALGNSNMEFAGSLFVAPPFLPATYHGALGSVYVDTGAAPAFDRTASNGREFDLGIALPSNTLNQALLSLYQGGVLDQISMAMKPADLGSMGSLLSTVGVDATADMRMRLVPGAVPYFTLDHIAAAGKTAGLKLHMDNAAIYMDVKKAGETEFFTMLAMTADIAANLQLGMNGNFIDLDTDALLAMDVVSILPQGLAAPGSAFAGMLTPALIESQIGDAVGALLKTDTLSDALHKTVQIAVTMAPDSNFLLQLPYDIGIILRDVRADDSDAYLMMQVDLLNNTETHNAVEPLTARIDIDKR